MSTDQLVETIVIRPTVTLTPTAKHSGLTSEYSFKPLSNLIYMRDQQITTAKGIVMGHLKTPQRRLETEVMHFAFSKLGEMPIRFFRSFAQHQDALVDLLWEKYATSFRSILACLHTCGWLKRFNALQDYGLG